jgi:HEAT repeat protein
MPPVTIGKAISMLRSAIVNARIYPKGSQMIESTLKGAHKALEGCLAETSPIIISDLQGKLCVNGKETVEAKDFRPFLIQHEVQSIKLFKGLQVTEVASLMEGLGKRKGQLDEQKNLADWLKAQGATHVQVEEVEFVELKKGEVVVQQILSLLEQSTDTSSLTTSLDESVRLIDQLPDDASRKDAHKKIAQHLSGLPPYQIRELFDSKLTERVEKSGLKDDVVQVMSREKLEEALEEVNKWYHQIKQESKSEFEVVEKLNGLKSFLGKILHSPASKAVPFALYEELLNVGLLEQMPAGVQKGEHAGLLTEVEHLLSQPDEALLELPVRQRFPELLKALCAMGLDEPIGKLTEKMLHNLHNPAPVVREAAVKTIRVFQETLASNRKEKPFQQIISTLHTLSESESAPDVYGHVADALQSAAMELLVHWRFEESTRLLATLRRHSREESPIGQKKKQLAAAALHEFSTRVLDVICADLNAPVKDRQNGAYRVLAELSEDSVGPLVEAVKRSIDSRARQAAIQALRRLGRAVKEPLLKQVDIGMPGDVLVKLIPIFEDFADASILPTLTGLLQHPDGSVRRQVAQLLARVKEPKVQSLLAGLLDDTDPEVQTEAVRLIGELRLKLATLELARRLPTAPPVVQEEMCIALGSLGEKRAIPELIQVLETRRSFWKRTGGTPEAVCVRAIWALGQLLPDEAAQRALGRALKHSSPMIQRAAQNALSRLGSPPK